MGSVRFLLPFQPLRHDVDEVDEVNPPKNDRELSLNTPLNDEYNLLKLYRQAAALVQPQSTSATRTLGAVVHDPSLVKRILQRQQPYAKELDRRSRFEATSTPLPAVSSSTPSNASQSSSNSRLAFLRACEELMVSFDPEIQHSRRMKLDQIKPLLRFHGLKVDDAAFRQWEQRVSPIESHPAMAGRTVSVSDFIQACQLWFTDSFLVEHVRMLSTKKNASIAEQKLRPPTYNRHLSSAHVRLTPFEQLAQESHATTTFSYEAYARLPPSQAPLSASASAPALLHGKFCAHHKPDMATRAAVMKLRNVKLLHHQKKECEAMAHRARQGNAETARVFNASVAMISRHVHNEVVRNHHENELDLKIARTDRTRHWSEIHKAHCQAIQQDMLAQRMREVCAMKALNKEELNIAQDLRALRAELARRNKSLFGLSPSTSTIFSAPPEILAAQSTATSQADYRRLARLEREHAKHMHSLQLLDYAYDRKRMMADALQPRADSYLVELNVHNDQLPTHRVKQLAEDELWRQLVQLQEQGDPDAAALCMPPTNSPPAALRHFGISRPITQPALASSVEREL